MYTYCYNFVQFDTSEILLGGKIDFKLIVNNGITEHIKIKIKNCSTVHF